MSPLQRALVRSMVALCALSAGCRARPTQVTLLVDSNVDRTRPLTLSILALEGARSVDELRGVEGTIERLNNGARELFPGSLSVVPRTGGPRSGVVSLLAVLDAPEREGMPAFRIERVQRLSLSERSPQQARMFFNIQCSSLAVGCTSVASAQCTLSRRCIELGQTCGDDGVCAPIELPMVNVPPGVPLDATVETDASVAREASALDASDASDALDASDASDASDVPMDLGDARADAGACGPGFHALGNGCVADGGVRPVLPLSLGDTSLRRPALRFVLPSGADGAVIELCRDRACSMVIETLRVTGTEARPAADLPPSSVVFWRGRARVGATEDALSNVGPTWLFHTPARDNSRATDTSSHPHLDVNGDGFDDVVIGSEFGAATSGMAAVGTVTEFHGSTTGLNTTAVRRLDGPSSSSSFGISVACAGDVNGDGYADIIVGAPGADPIGRPNAGTASIFLGSSTGLRATAATVLDGTAVDDRFGWSVAGAGDMDADGYADVIVGADLADPGGRTSAGTASLYFGSATGVSSTPSRVFEGGAADDQFGWSVAGAGDVNSDGFSDLIVGAPFADPSGKSSAGTASVFMGRRGGILSLPSHVFEGGSDEDQLGFCVASAGDFNGDGLSDVIVSAPAADPSGMLQAGAVSIIRPTATGFVGATVTVHTGAAAGDALGRSVASARDVNGDGFSDVIMGAPLADPAGNVDAGVAWVLLGNATTLSLAPLLLQGEAVSDQFGAAVAGAGDVDADGFSDIIVGAAFADPGGLTNAGAATFFRGGMLTVISSPSAQLRGREAGDTFGRSVASHRARSPLDTQRTIATRSRDAWRPLAAPSALPRRNPPLVGLASPMRSTLFPRALPRRSTKHAPLTPLS